VSSLPSASSGRSSRSSRHTPLPRMATRPAGVGVGVGVGGAVAGKVSA
jgi:hypothetical protein